MDSITHTIVGIGIAGTAIGLFPSLEGKIIEVGIVAIAASNLPDLDVVVKMISDEYYLRIHRGLSHKIYFWFIESFILAGLLFNIISISFVSIFMISLVCIAVHVFLDVGNSYGTQVYKEKWYSWNLTHSVDPAVILLFLTAIALKFYVKGIFLIVSIFYLFYLMYKRMHKRYIVKKITEMYPNRLLDCVFPTINPFKWYVILENEDSYLTFNLIKNKPTKLHYLKKSKIDPIWHQILKENSAYELFLKQSKINFSTINSREDMTEIIFYSLKYRKKETYYFSASFLIVNEIVVSQYVGWCFDERKRKKKLYF